MPTLSLGRGRLGKKPVDENNHQLPAPQVRDVEPDKDFYSKPARIAKLPLAYYRKREGPTVQVCTHFKKENYLRI
ncbi:unnamed protein product [Rotaria sordida]|uniref:Uncharacterized protein n=1 Tax=Rotaria sordida TaxID=392033 RepID=A0A815THP0_9BILA|nr:unnamed protein product [Rotaria sordida]